VKNDFYFRLEKQLLSVLCVVDVDVVMNLHAGGKVNFRAQNYYSTFGKA